MGTEKSKTYDDEARKQLASLLQDARIAMLTTMDNDGNHIARPMAIQEAQYDGDLWFFADSGSRKVQQIIDNPQVGVTICDNDKSFWVSLSGNAEIVYNNAKKHELWNPVLKAWFPEGEDSPELTLIKVTPSGAEYWDSPGGKVATLISMASSVVRGKPANPGDNERVDL